MPALQSTSRPSSDLLQAVSTHGIGRGEFAALVFSGARAALGDIPGHYTWDTPIKFALPDPRLGRADDFAPLSQLPEWPAGDLRPIEGVCFVFADSTHPAVQRLREQGAEEFEHFVCLNRLGSGLLLEQDVSADRVLPLAGSLATGHRTVEPDLSGGWAAPRTLDDWRRRAAHAHAHLSRS